MAVDWNKVNQPELVMQRFGSRRSVVHGTKGLSSLLFIGPSVLIWSALLSSRDSCMFAESCRRSRSGNLAAGR
jgi:hypothetical protein